MTLTSRTAADRVLDEISSDITITDPDLLGSYAHDESRFTAHALPVAVLAPRCTDEVSLCLAAAHRHKVPVIPRGAGSGLSGGANATADALVLSLHRMNHVLEVNEADRLAVVQPGVITAELRARAAGVGLFYPPDPGSVEFSTVGGNVATNAGGMCCVKYGVTGDFVIGLEAVLADGRVLRTGRRTVKGVAGYDLTHLLVGSEGTLGVITEVTVRLVPKPATAHTLVASFGRLTDAGAVVAEIARSGIIPSLLEILDRTTIHAVDAMTNMGLGDAQALLLIQADDAAGTDALLQRVEQICVTHGAEDIARSTDPVEADMLLQARRLALPALERLGDWLLDDVAVPRSRIVDLIAAVQEISAQLDLRIGVFGHAGDGNLHPTVIFDDADPDSRAAAHHAFNRITQKALELGGTITGEHGIGLLKKQWLTTELNDVAAEVQATIKHALDPTRILNPSKVIDAIDHHPDAPRDRSKL